MNPAREHLWAHFGRLVDLLHCVETKANRPRTNVAPLLDEFLTDPEAALATLERHLHTVTAST